MLLHPLEGFGNLQLSQVYLGIKNRLNPPQNTAHVMFTSSFTALSYEEFHSLWFSKIP